MRKTTTVRAQWQLLLVLLFVLVNLSDESIDGVTYHNHFDFEERYRNVRECDPFYWHPLHLPEHCTKMYEKLIRSRVAAAAQIPVRVVRRRPHPNIYSYNDYADYQQFYDGYRPHRYILPDDTSETEENESMSPYQEMYNLLKKDVKKNPTAPVVGMVPSYGPIAVYKQPISKKSKDLITKISRMYAKAGIMENDDDYYFGNIDVKYPGFGNINKDKNKKKIDINNDVAKDKSQES